MTPQKALWMIVGGVLATYAVAQGSLSLINLLATHTTTESLDLSGIADADAVERIRIDGFSGVRVTAAEADTPISGELAVTHDLWSPDQHTHVDGDTLVLESECPLTGTLFCGITYDLTVPTGLAVETTSGYGDITVIAVEAAIDLSSSGGDITVIDADGPITLHTSGGDVDVVDSGGDLDLSSSGGSIRATGSTAERVTSGSSGGEITLGFIETPTLVEASTSGGDLVIRVPADDSLYDVEVHTAGGGSEITVRTDPSSERSIIARTSGGDVAVLYGDDGGSAG
jgi:hypothetical protein